MAPRLPFNKETFGHLESASLLPASTATSASLASPTDHLEQFLWEDLYVGKLNRLHSSLWSAGRARPARPLNFYIASSNKIVLDERINMHLIWEDPDILHLKPIPRYLLDAEFWETNLLPRGIATIDYSMKEAPSRSRELYRCAMGFLSSYVGMIRYESDLAIAQHHRLVPKEITWPQWHRFVEQLHQSRAISPSNINPRYLFGELQLSQLNGLTQSWWNRSSDGPYQYTYKTYREFFEAQMYSTTAITVYVVLVLTAMQVGLGTTRLSDAYAFQWASVFFTLWSIMFPLIVFFTAFVLLSYRFGKHMAESKRFAKAQTARFEISDPIPPDRFQ